MNAYIVVCNGAAWRIKADDYVQNVEGGIASAVFYRNIERCVRKSYETHTGEIVRERSPVAFLSGTQVVVLQEDCLDPPPGPTDKPMLASVLTHPAAKED